MTSPGERLNVFLYGARVGTIERHAKGYELSYEPDVRLPHPLSHSLRHTVARTWMMPVHRYKGDAVWEGNSSPLGNFLFGLLPDNPDVLSEMSRRYGVEDRNPVELLAHVGVDSVGAVQFSSSDAIAAPDRSALVPISPDEIEEALRAARARGVRYEGAAQGATRDGSYGPGSLLAGFQPKFGLLRDGDTWLRSTPEWGTTHIFKTGVAGKDGQAAFEFVGMRAASHAGLEVAPVSIVDFGDEHALIVERFDRRPHGAAPPARVHQEDLAQLLSVPVFPARKKYGREATRIVKTLASLEGGREVAHSFVRQLAYNTLIGNADAHLKNYSVRYDPGTGALSMTPLYDCATDAHDPQFHSDATSPVRIGGTVDYSAIQRSAVWWRNLSKSGGLDEARVMAEVRGLARDVPEAVITAVADLPSSHRQRVERSGSREAIAQICANIERAITDSGSGNRLAPANPPPDSGRSEVQAGETLRARPACGQVMPRRGVPCVLPAGHSGPHRSR